MQPRCVAGHLFRPGVGFVEGWFTHDGARILEAGEGKPPEHGALTGVALPMPVDAHTHVGDRVGRGADIKGKTLHEVVSPPDGIKHRILRDTSPEKLVAGIREALVESLAHGTRRFIDFRERGLEGVKLLRQAAEGLPVAPTILGRPVGAWDDTEAEQVLAACDGFGLSALRDTDGDVPERMAALAHRHNKRFALHLSEGRREDVGRALDLRPQLIVHMVHATREDLAAVASARVPVAICPRSNALFGPLPDVRGMLEAGVRIALGSDNAMFHELDVLADARLLLERDPKLDPVALLDALTAGGRNILGDPLPRDPYAPGAPAEHVVYAPSPAGPLDALFGKVRPRVLATTLKVPA